MKKFLIAMMLIASSLSVIATDAQAARLGGGRSFGRQSPTATRQAPMQKQAAPAQQAQPTTGQTPAQAGAAMKPPSPWRGILGGALLGLGLGALLSSMGIGGAASGIIGTILMVALIGFALLFVFRLLTRKKEEPGRQDAYASGYQGGYSSSSAGSSTPEIGSGLGAQVSQPAAFQADSAASSATYVPYGIPADFDVPAFLRSAKTYFIRLQASWDKADIYDIREYTTAEMYAELKMQMQERGASSNVTDVVTLDAALLGIENIGDEQMASVQFSGTLKESQEAPATEFYEVWNLTRPLTGKGGWVLAGIQQVN
jgi:predicted lipid-binding transport protein (Tim44 family)